VTPVPVAYLLHLATHVRPYVRLLVQVDVSYSAEINRDQHVGAGWAAREGK
jgi:hypothetical protein